MLECPVCKYTHKKIVSTCKRCNLSENDISLVNRISSENPIFAVCIPTLVKKLNKYREIDRQNQILLDINKIYRKLQILETERREDKQRINKLEKTVVELKSHTKSKDNRKNIDLNSEKEPEVTTYYQTSSFQGNFLSNYGDRPISQAGDYRSSDFSGLETIDENYDFASNHDRTLVNEESDHISEDSFCNQIDTSDTYSMKNAEYLQIVESYNRDKTSLQAQAISIVLETQESMENRLDGRSETVYLSHDSKKGKYLIVEENSNYYLVPHSKININEHNKHTIEYLFEFDESSSINHDLKLIRPAKVFKTSLDLWQLDKKGKLEFC